jgi:PAS domain S-box-containing protein
VNRSPADAEVTPTMAARRRRRTARARAMALADAMHALTEAGPGPEAVLVAVAHQAAIHVGDLAVVRLLSADGRWLESAVVDHPDPSAREAAAAAVAAERHPADLGVNGTALQSGRPCWLAGKALAATLGAGNGQLWPPLPEAPTAALLAAPLRAEGRAIGTLSVSRASPHHAYDGEDARFVQELADRAGLVIERARLFAQARASEERLRLATEANRMVAWEWDATTDRTTTSGSIADVFGLAMRSGGGEGAGFAWPEDWPDHQEKVARIAREGGDYRSQFRITRPSDGQVIWLEERATALTDAAGAVARVAGVVTDISDRKSAEDALRLSEAHARFLAEASAVLAASLDYDEAVEQVVRLAVPLFADWCVVDLIGGDGALHRLAIVHRDPARAEVATALRDGYPTIPPGTNHTAWTVLRTGIPWFDPDVARGRFVAEVRDERHLALLSQLGFTSELVAPLVARDRVLGVLTLVYGASGRRYGPEDVAFAEDLARHCALAIDNARLYREARDAEAKVRRLFDAGVIGLLVADPEHILEANDHFLRTVGYTRGELAAGRLHWAELIAPEYAYREELAIAEIAARGFCTPFETEYVRKDGSRAPILIGAAALHGTSPPWICGVLDLTAQKAAEQDRVEFIDAATHDLKNPLTSLKGRAQLLLRRARREQTIEAASIEPGLAAIDADVNRMVALIDELMDAAHLRTGRALDLRLAAIDLVALAENGVTDLQGRVLQSVAVETVTPAVIGSWDQHRLERVLQNLLNNAAKYSHPGSHIAVRISREDGPEGAAWATLSVQDEGVGIPAADLPHIFERFRRGGNVGETAGAGIGLAGAKQIVEQHGGTITVESVEGEGSTFVVRLPIEAG